MGIFDRFRKDKPAKSERDTVTSEAAAQDSASEVEEASGDAVGGTPARGGGTGGGSGGVMGMFRRAMRRTAELLNTDIRDLFKQEGRLVDDQFLDEIFVVLIKTDMGAEAAREICDELGQQFRARRVERLELVDAIKEKFRSMLVQERQDIQLADSGPTVVMVVGVNGSGKTTSIAKLAHRFVNVEGRRVVLGAGDTFRAAAVEQLAIWSERIGAEIVKGTTGGDPASVAHRAVSRAVETQADICIIDTAGRLQTQVNLMQELSKIRRVIGKIIPDAPHEVLLVLDATAGQNGVSQARGFSEAAQCTGIVLAKLDGTAKGGVIIPIRKQFNLPVKFIGEGERETDLAVFETDRFVDALFEEAK